MSSKLLFVKILYQTLYENLTQIEIPCISNVIVTGHLSNRFQEFRSFDEVFVLRKTDASGVFTFISLLSR